jgi:O-acetyl-ADP-ribose deacetylase (regulator of RNase III)
VSVIFKEGDLTLDSADVLVNTVNCVGVMGKGLALKFKNKWPEYFKDYKVYCDNNELQIGTLHQYCINTGQTLLSFPTKQHWRNPSQTWFVQTGLKALEELLKDFDGSIAVPKLGCGLGGLKWTVVLPLILQTAKRLPNIEFRIYGEEL